MIYAGVIAQTSLVSADLPGRPFLPAILLVLIAACSEPTPAILWSGLLGLILDGLSMERLGVQLAMASLLALGLQMFRPLWNSRSLLALVAMIVITCMAWRMLSPMTLAILGGRAVNPNQIFRDAVQVTCWTLLAGGILVLIGRGMFGNSGGDRKNAPRPAAKSGWTVAS